jgi:biopolymer transport protein ExbD
MRKKSRRRTRKPTELLLVPMIDIFTVLVTFLLMTAVFSRITILELDLPSSQGTRAAVPSFRLEVIIRKDGLELTNGATMIAAIPKVNGEYDLKTLSQLALSLKRDYPDADDASVLLEPDTMYDNLIQVMDAIRTTDVVEGAESKIADPTGPHGNPGVDEVGEPKPTRVALFTDISVGDAP